MTRIETDIENERISSCLVYAPIDEALEILKEKGYRLISLPENVKLKREYFPASRIPFDRKDERKLEFKIGLESNFVREGYVWVPGEGCYLVRNSPLLDDPKKTRELEMSEGLFIPLNESQVKKALEDSIKVEGDFIYPFNIPSFCGDDIAIFAFGGGNPDETKKYEKYLKELGIKRICLWNKGDECYARRKNPVATQVRFNGFLHDGGLYTGNDIGRDITPFRGIKER